MAVAYQKLRDADLFKDFSETALQKLAQQCRTIELPAGATLFEQGDPGDSLYLLETGQIHVMRQYPDGEQVILATEGPYYVVGELSMLVNQPRTGAVVAVSDCTLIALQRQTFVDVCAEMPDVAIKVLAEVSTRLYRMNLQVRENAIGNVAARVASVLLLLTRGGNVTVDQPVRVSRVARAAATDADVVERLLSQWQQQGYITFDGQHLTVLDADVLHNIAG